MRVLMLNNEFPPLGGGTGTVNQALLRQFSKFPSVEIDLITSALGTDHEDEKFAENIHIYKVPVNNRNIHHSSNRELTTYAMRGLRFAWKLHREQPYDLCLAWSAVPAGAMALALKLLIKLPYLVRVSGPDIPGFERRYRLLYPILTPIIRATWQGAKIVVAKCESEAELIRAVDKNVNLALIPNGVNFDAFKPGDPISNGEPLRLLCVGRLIERKGQYQLIMAMKHLKEQGVIVSLDLIGKGDAEDKYRAQAKDLGVENEVRFIGYVPREEIAKYYATAHVFVLASYNEGMSVATLEAMAAGLPVVTTRTGGSADLISEGVNGFTFEWGDVDTLTDHLTYLANNRASARKMAIASRERAMKFTWDYPANRYLELFKSFGKN